MSSGSASKNKVGARCRLMMQERGIELPVKYRSICHKICNSSGGYLLPFGIIDLTGLVFNRDRVATAGHWV